MTKIAYLNNHLEKYRDKPDIRFDINDLEYLSNYSNLYKEDKKTTKAFIQCFKSKATYKELLNKNYKVDYDYDLLNAISKIPRNKPLFITGSLYLMGEVLKINSRKND